MLSSQFSVDDDDNDDNDDDDGDHTKNSAQNTFMRINFSLRSKTFHTNVVAVAETAENYVKVHTKRKEKVRGEERQWEPDRVGEMERYKKVGK